MGRLAPVCGGGCPLCVSMWSGRIDPISGITQSSRSSRSHKWFGQPDLTSQAIKTDERLAGFHASLANPKEGNIPGFPKTPSANRCKNATTRKFQPLEKKFFLTAKEFYSACRQYQPNFMFKVTSSGITWQTRWPQSSSRQASNTRFGLIYWGQISTNLNPTPGFNCTLLPEIQI